MSDVCDIGETEEGFMNADAKSLLVNLVLISENP